VHFLLSTFGAANPFWVKAPEGQTPTAGQRWFWGQRWVSTVNTFGSLGPAGFKPKNDAMSNAMVLSSLIILCSSGSRTVSENSYSVKWLLIANIVNSKDPFQVSLA